jgi:DNA-binding transcriptional LysR family regulator
VQTLDLSVMRTLMAVVENGSFARAARRVGRSESAVSLQMKRLEEQLGEAVFLRTGKRMALTDAGTTLLGYAQRLLDLNDEALTATSSALGQRHAGGSPRRRRNLVARGGRGIFPQSSVGRLADGRRTQHRRFGTPGGR